MRASKHSLFLLITIFVFSTTSCPAETVTVSGSIEAIKMAIEAASFGDVVVIGEGTYEGNNIIMKNGVSLCGEGDDPTLVIIDGEGGGPIIKCNAYHEGTISGLTLRNGSASRGSGGGIMCGSNSTPEIVNCVFSNNSADRFGGGFYALLSEPALLSCRFENNTAGQDGGGAYFTNSSPSLNDCAFTTNNAVKGGGLMAAGNSYPTLVDCTFSGNTASSSGAGLASINSTPTLLRCSFVENESSDGASGGLFGSLSTVSMDRCTISGNSAFTSAGGLLLTDSSTMTASESVFLNNNAPLGRDIEVETGSQLHLICCEYESDYFAGSGSITFDNEDCSSPVETSTWGAVRTLYR